ncbi:peptide chain release factor N(5)-glutamine methyltransferase [Pseudoxanthomonas sp.]|uniref:peptide chain release factor N(5)-glutamine methyltransferase n=1 Tax=Pseudoxanthomonas sp. TaxID=1871049 RepID=UPI002624B05A|nr:peptide chain release factor N(5)-glutamine methyltransferase [Pseudoxanthomonas sp.]WDS35867.1 MAG: peptide chain release factor N(5)-glutamine methyltransferase [Pseudoxanthomonas sp.]
MNTLTSPRLDALLRDGAARLSLSSPEARFEAEQLLLHALGRERAWLFTHGSDPVEAPVQTAFAALLERRLTGEPLAYITGTRGFWTLDLQVTPATLIPRAETERLVELALERLPPDRALQVADLGTGSGAIALAVASERPQAKVLATDASGDALAVAQANAKAHALANVDFAHGDWFAPLAGRRFDLIASNPPYIEAGDAHLEQGDLRFEPATALASGADGLDDIRRIAAQARAHLLPDGWLLLEHGFDQGEPVRALLVQAGLDEVQTAQDLEGRDRVTLGRNPSGTP